MSTRAGIFDLDGTLIDTYDAHFEAWKTACVPYGVAVTTESFARDFGRANPPIIRALWKDQNLQPPDEALIARVADEKEALFRDILAQDFRPMPGAVALLRSLAENDWLLGIGTSAPQANLDQGIDGLGIRDIIGATTCGEEVQQGKPDPEVFLKCAQRLGVTPAQSVVVEDAPAGIEAAKRAEMASIGLASKGRTRNELQDADLVIDSLEEIDRLTFSKLIDSGH